MSVHLIDVQRLVLLTAQGRMPLDQDLVLRIAVPIGTALFGGVVGHLLTERRSRITELRFWLETSRVADPPAGLISNSSSLEVRFNGRPVTDLHVSKVHLQNLGPSDLKDLIVTIGHPMD